jgi:hypothetical protein
MRWSRVDARAGATRIVGAEGRSGETSGGLSLDSSIASSRQSQALVVSLLSPPSRLRMEQHRLALEESVYFHVLTFTVKTRGMFFHPRIAVRVSQLFFVSEARCTLLRGIRLRTQRFFLGVSHVGLRAIAHCSDLLDSTVCFDSAWALPASLASLSRRALICSSSLADVLIQVSSARW